jgi:hypothetical protein
MSLKSLLSNTNAGGTKCTIQTKTADKVTSTRGKVAETWANTYTSVECALQKITGQMRREESGLHEDSTHLLFLEYSAVISAGNRVVVGSDTYFVLDVDPVGQHHKEVQLKLLNL